MRRPSRRSRLLGGSTALLAAVAGLALWPAAPALAQSATAAGGAPGLAPLLADLSRPSLRAQSPHAQAGALDLPASGPGSLQREGNRVLVSVRFDHGALAGVPALEEAGATVSAASRRYQTATASVPPGRLPALLGAPGVAWVAPVRTPLLAGAGEASCDGGSVVSEGLQQLRVAQAREAFGLRGGGVTVGVLSDSFDRATTAVGGGAIATHAEQDVASNDLPGPAGTCGEEQEPVNVLEEGPSGEGEDEGRAMLQIVHDLAPHASLAFATAFSGEIPFAQNIERLARPVAAGGAGAGVIVDDVSYFEEPFFQDGPVAAAVGKVVSEGVTYLSAAGNDNLFDSSGREIASWEAPEFRDGGPCPSGAGATAVDCMDFDPSVDVDTGFGITVEPESELLVDLQWAEPWNGVGADLDAYLLNKSGGELLTSSTEDNVSGGRPVEVLAWENTSASAREVQVAVSRCFGACNPGASVTARPRLKLALLENGGGVEETEYPASSGGDVVGPTVFGHAGAAVALAVGAIRYDAVSAPEPYSSRGPVTHYFGPVTGAAPAAPLASPELIQKPDFVATDCGATTFFASLREGAWRFCGTSAAAPHAAAIAALMLQRDPALTPEGVRSKLRESARAVGSFGAEAVGSGLVDAMGSLEASPWTVIGQESVEPAPIEVAPDTQTPTPFSSPPSHTSSGPQPTAGPAPRTHFRKHPPKVVGTHRRRARVVFVFAANQQEASFLCKLDRGRWRRCPRRLVHRFGLGRHVVRAMARSSAGLVDGTPAVFRFAVRRR